MRGPRTTPAALGLIAAACLALAPPAASRQSPCEAPDAWFADGGPGQPDANQDFGSNCDFHQWAWQSFLWLTQPDGDRLRFMAFAPPDRLFDRTPAPFAAAARGTPRLSASLRNTDQRPAYSAVQQAGPGSGTAGTGAGILVHRNGRAVYYSMYINDTFFNFVQQNKLNFYETFRAADPKTTYPPGALQLKAAWRVVEDGEPKAGWYVTKALVDPLKLGTDAQGAPVVLVDTTAPPRDVWVALVGLHVVGVVKDHPEFVWATFEHKDNAPDVAPGAPPANPVGPADRTFYAANTPLKDCNRFDPARVTLDPAAQRLTPVSNIARLAPPGSPADLALVRGLTQSVHAKLKADSVWKNYDLVGSVWLPPDVPLAPNMAPAGKATGSTRLVNTTMESFTQNLPNCFSCHDTRKQELRDDAGLVLSSLPPSNLNLSHALVEPLLVQGARQALGGGTPPGGRAP